MQFFLSLSADPAKGGFCMFDTSKDILNLIIAACVAVFTFFLCYLLYYIISMLKQANKTVTEIRQRIESFDALLESVKEKLTHSSNYLALLVKSIVSLMEFVKERKDKKSAKSKKTYTP